MRAGQSAADLALLIPLMLVCIVRLLLIGCRLFLKTDGFFNAMPWSHIQLKVLPSTQQEVEGRVSAGSEGFFLLWAGRRVTEEESGAACPPPDLLLASSVLQLVNAPATARYTVRGQR